MPGNKKPRKKRERRPPVPDMVVVTVHKTRNGRSLDVGTTGKINLTEAPILLKLAAKVAEQQLGLE